MTRAGWFALLLVAAACRDRSSSPPKPPASAAADAAVAAARPPDAGPPAITAPDDAHRFDCGADGDCINSCKWGAVNRGWYDQASKRPDFGECEDGCANQIAEKPRCEAGSCVAYQSDPRDPKKITRADDCTRKEP